MRTKLLAALSQCNPSTDHISYSRTVDQLTVKKGSISEAYGWKYNSWLLNYFGCYSYPDDNYLNSRKLKCELLTRQFINLVTHYGPDLDKEKQIIKIQQIILKQLDKSYIGLKINNSFKPLNIQTYNKIINKYECDLVKTINLLKELTVIRKELTLLGVTDTQKVLSAYIQCMNQKITFIEFERVLLKSTQDHSILDNKAAYLRYLTRLKQDILNKLHDNRIWGNFRKKPVTPPTPRCTVNAMDFEKLFKRLNSYLPTDPGKVKEKPVFKSREELFQLCDDLMTVSSRIMSYVYRDLKERKEKQNLTKEELAGLLIRRDRYMAKAFSFLPRAYETIKALHHQKLDILPKDWEIGFTTEGTKQSEWETTYRTRRQEIRGLIGRRNLNNLIKEFQGG